MNVCDLQDPRQRETWDFAASEIAKGIPEHIETVIVLNFKDEFQLWRVPPAEIRDFVEIARENVCMVEASLVRGYGVAELRNCFAVPFHRLQVP